MKFFNLIALMAVLGANSASAFTFDNNVPQAIRTEITQDLAFMGGIQGGQASGLHAQIFGPTVSGAAYLQFFNSRVTAVGLNGCGDPKAVACVIPFLNHSKVWLTPNYTKFDHPQIAKMMIVYHESRHTENAHENWPHATCPTPFTDPNGNEIRSIWTGATLAGEPACDVTPFGSYGSSMILLKNISKFCTNCTDKVKQDAGLYADDQFKRVIDPQAIQQIRQDLYNN